MIHFHLLLQTILRQDNTTFQNLAMGQNHHQIPTALDLDCNKETSSPESENIRSTSPIPE